MSGASTPAPRRVFLFSGHMIDRPNRAQTRFPVENEGLVALRILDALETLDAGVGDLGICGGAAGGDLIFAEACLGLGLEVEVLLPHAVEEFVDASVDPSGTGWKKRFEDVVGSPGVRLEVMDEHFLSGQDLGLYSRHGRWLIDRAITWGAEKLEFLALWDGKPGDGSGGTADVLAAVEDHTDRVHVIAPT